MPNKRSCEHAERSDCYWGCASAKAQVHAVYLLWLDPVFLLSRHFPSLASSQLSSPVPFLSWSLRLLSLNAPFPFLPFHFPLNLNVSGCIPRKCFQYKDAHGWIFSTFLKAKGLFLARCLVISGCRLIIAMSNNCCSWQLYLYSNFTSHGWAFQWTVTVIDQPSLFHSQLWIDN